MIVNGIDISDCPFIDNDEKECIFGCLTENCLYKQKKDSIARIFSFLF